MVTNLEVILEFPIMQYRNKSFQAEIELLKMKNLMLLFQTRVINGNSFIDSDKKGIECNANNQKDYTYNQNQPTEWINMRKLWVLFIEN